MSGIEWPVVFEDAYNDRLSVEVFCSRVLISIMQENGEETSVALTPAQSAILRAALEAAEKGMS